MRQVACVLGAIALAALTLAGSGSAKRPDFVGPVLEHPAAPPDFTLRDQAGRAVHLRALHGKVVLLTFLYTHCPDVCPVTAGNLNTALLRLGAKRDHVAVLAVSVDPVGDTHASILKFIRQHRLLPQFRYLTGRQGALERVWRTYDVKAVRNKDDGGVDHTLYTLLVDRSGTARVIFDSTATPVAITHDVRQLL